MGILNNIWLAMNAPNPTLITLIAIPAIIIENYLIMNLFLALSDIKTNFTSKILYITSMSILSFLNMHLIHSNLNLILNFIFMITLARLIFKIYFLKSCFVITISAMFFTIINSIILNPFLYVFKLTCADLTSIPSYRILYIAIVYIIVSLITFLIKNSHLKLSILDNNDKKSKLIIISNLFLAVTSIIIQYFIHLYYIDALPLIITLFSALSLILYYLVTFYSFKKISKLTVTTKELEITKEYNHTLRILHDNIRAFKHDFDNIVTTIGGYIKTNDMEGLEKYYSQLQDDCQRVNNLYVLNPEIVNNDGIYNLITTKYNEADSKNIKFNISFLLDLNNLKMKIYEFSRILGILLDNAIEASSESNEKIINLTFRNDPKNSRQLIIIENSYSNKNINTEKIFEKGISSKDNHSGLGLWEVRKIISKTKNANLFTSKNNNYFIQQLELYY